MKPKLLILSLLFLLTNISFAQKIIKLEGEISGLQDFDYYIEDVIVGQNEKDCIGFAQTGMWNTKIASFFDENIKIKILEFLSANFPKAPGKKPLIIKLNKIYISELTLAMAEYAFANLNINFIEAQDSIYIKRFQAVASTKRSGVDVTALHDNNIVNVFSQCFKEFEIRDNLNLLSHDTLNIFELHSQDCNKADYPILDKSQLRKGVFLTFNDFRDNIICKDFPFDIKYRTKEDTTFSAKIKFKNDHPDEYWGFCDGKNLFMQIEDKSYPLSLVNGRFVLYPKSYDISNQNGIAFAGMMFGVFGAAIATMSQPSSVERFYLDLCTGNIFPDDRQSPFDIIGSKVFYYSDYSKLDTGVCISYNDQKMLCLREGQYAIIDFQPTRSEFEIKITTSDKDILVEDFDPNYLDTQLFLIKVKKKGKLTVTECTGKTKLKILEDLEDKQRVY